MPGDIGAGRKVGVVARDQHAILGGQQVHFNYVGAEFDGADIGFQRFLGQVTRSTPVRHDQGQLAIERWQHG